MRRRAGWGEVGDKRGRGGGGRTDEALTERKRSRLNSTVSQHTASSASSSSFPSFILRASILLLLLLRSSSPCRRRSPRGCHGEDPGVVRVFRGRGQEHPAGLVPDRLRDPQPLHPGLLLAQPDPAEPPEQAGQLHGEPGCQLRAATAAAAGAAAVQGGVVDVVVVVRLVVVLVKIHTEPDFSCRLLSGFTLCWFSEVCLCGSSFSEDCCYHTYCSTATALSTRCS